MAESSAFSRMCEELETQTSLDRLASRGTVRLALKKAGLEPRAVTSQQMSVVLSKVLPAELASRGVADAEAACRAIASRLETLASSAGAAETPDAVFARLGGSDPSSEAAS